MRHPSRPAGICLLLSALAVSSTAAAGRIQRLTGSVDLMAALDNNPLGVSDRFFDGSLQRTMGPSYAVFPGIEFSSTGAKSDLHVRYTGGWTEASSPLGLGYASHELQGSLNTQLTPRFKIAFSDSYTRSPDFFMFDLLRGGLLAPELNSSPLTLVVLHRNGYFNKASADLEYASSPRSIIRFSASHYIRTFEDTAGFRQPLSDQQVWTGIFEYTRSINPKTTWEMGYSVDHYDFRSFQNARTHNGYCGVSHDFTPSLHLRLNAGPSYTHTPASDSVSYLGPSGSLSLSKSFQRQGISFQYKRWNGATAGVGTVSDVQSAALSYTRSLEKKGTITAETSLYHMRQRFENFFSARGKFFSLIFETLMQRNWILRMGGSYLDLGGSDLFGVERTRIFVSLRYIVPEKWRPER